MLRYAGVVLVFLAAATLAVISGDAIRYYDEHDYDTLARSVVAGQGFALTEGQPSVFRAPGYPALLSLAYLPSGSSVLVAKLVNACLLAGTAWILLLLTERLKPSAGWLTPFILLAFPTALYASSTLYPQILSCFLLAVTVWLLTSPNIDRGGYLGVGAVYGFLCLAVPSFLVLSPVPVIAAMVRAGPSKQRLIGGGFVAVAMIAVVLPWAARNYAVTGALVPISANSGYNLALGNSPFTRADSGVDVPVERWCPIPPGSDEVATDLRYRGCALAWISQNKFAAAQLYAEKAAYWFSPSNRIRTQPIQPLQELVLTLSYLGLVAIIVLRLACVRSLPLQRVELIIMILYVLGALASAVFFSRIRFRLPFDVLLMPIAAAFVVRLIDRLRMRVANSR